MQKQSLSSDEESSSPLHKGSPHPSKSSQTKLNRLPEPEREAILRRVLGTERGPRANPSRTVSCNNIHKSHKNCTSWVQRESSSSGEKSSHSNNDLDGELLHSWAREKPIAATRCPLENVGFAMSSHSNSAADESEI